MTAATPIAREQELEPVLAREPAGSVPVHALNVSHGLLGRLLLE